MEISKDDLWTVAQTIWGEARGEPIAGQYAVAHVIRNRAVLREMSLYAVCKQRAQFSCWRKSDPNRARMEALTADSPGFDTLLMVALEVCIGKHTDNTFWATHFHADSIKPSWAKGHTPCVHIGHHSFYNDIA